MSVNDVTSGSPDPVAQSPVGPGRVAVVSGAASGIGLGLAQRFAVEGMRVVMADVEEPALLKAAAGLAATGASVLPVVTDVADRATVEALREATLSALGASPADVAALVADGIRARRFYILTADNRNDAVLRRGQEIVSGGPPEPPVSFV